jgi:hypothetical protein
MEYVHTCGKPSPAICYVEIPDARRSGVREGKKYRGMQTSTSASRSGPSIYLFACIINGATDKCADFHMSARFYAREGQEQTSVQKKWMMTGPMTKTNNSSDSSKWAKGKEAAKCCFHRVFVDSPNSRFYCASSVLDPLGVGIGFFVLIFF